MIQIKKTLLTLVALLAVTTGAWATTPNSIVINGTPQVGDKSISLTYHFDPNNVSGLEPYVPSLKVKCAADNKWDETFLSFFDVSSGTTNISLNTLGEFEAGKTYEVCFAYNNGSWVDDVFQSFVPAAVATSTAVDIAWDAATKTGTFTQPAGNVTVSVEYFPKATADGAVTAATDVLATTDAPLVTVDATKLTGAAKMMYYVSTEATAPAYDAQGWTDVLPTAKDYTEAANLNVWYYPVGTDEGVGGATATYSDGDMNATALAVTVLSNKFDLTLKAANANTIDATQASKGTISVKEGTGEAVNKTEDITNGQLKAIKMGSEVKLSTKQGYKFRKVKVKKFVPMINVGGLELLGEEGQAWSTIVANNPDKIEIIETWLRRKDTGLFLKPNETSYVDPNTDSYNSSNSYTWYH